MEGRTPVTLEEKRLMLAEYKRLLFDDGGKLNDREWE
jgi:hypothetical protein